MKVSTRGSSPRAAIILAGGEGLRMRSVTRFITGQEDLPKQFCPMMDGMTWFENTRNRQPTPISTRFRPNFERLLHSANY
jgi:mannose-1-phosphate guanylyltransferase